MKSITPNWPAPSNVHAYTTTKLAKEALRDLITLPSEPVWLKQTHSTIVVDAAKPRSEIVADASFTSRANTICVVLTADCLPILICNKQGTYVAAIHAGWRGLANGIIESTLAAMQQPAHDLLVWLGPAIGPNKFEVGSDVHAAFVSKDAATDTCFKPLGNDKWLANLYGLARIRLQAAGVDAVYAEDYCTYSQPDLFYSYRRDKGQTGRLASLIWLG